MNKSKLRERCREFLESIERGMLPDTQKLEAFVMSEIGRAGHEKFEDAVPLVLFFHNKHDKDEFVNLVQAAIPGMISKAWP